MLGSYPRYRLYTSKTGYIQTLAGLIKGSNDHNTSDLEKTLAARFGCKHAICVPQARVGIYLTLKETIDKGQEVVMSPYTIADVVNMVLAAGGKPKFTEINGRTYNCDADDIVKQITASTGAVLNTHLHGAVNEAARIRDICDQFSVPMIEDSAQALGAKEGSKFAGTIGKAGIFSFGSYKNISTWFGGMVVTNDDELACRIRRQLDSFQNESALKILKKMRKCAFTDLVTNPVLFRLLTFWIFRAGMMHDIRWINRLVNTELDLNRYDTFPEAYRSKMTGTQALLASNQLADLMSNNLERVRKAEIYANGLEECKNIGLPPLRTDLSHIYTYYPVRLANRLDGIKWMMKTGRDCAAQHLRNCAELPSFREFYRELPIASRVAREVVLLPTYPRYPDSEVYKTIDALQRYSQTER